MIDDVDFIIRRFNYFRNCAIYPGLHANINSRDSILFLLSVKMSVIEKGPSTKEKLSSIVHGFDEFDLEMKKGTRVRLCNLIHLILYINTINTNHDSFIQQRREKDEFKITELKSEMNRLDTELNMEIKRRTEMNKSTQIVSCILLVIFKQK